MAVTSMRRSTLVDQFKTNDFVVTPNGFTFRYGVVAGGGGANQYGGGGGGGFRSSYASTVTGGGVTYPENPLFLSAGSYTVTVGAGGASGARGGSSFLATVESIGGGSAQGYNATPASQSGGSGSGASGNLNQGGGAGTPGQGFNGGAVVPDGVGGHRNGGGGGASSAGNSANFGLGITTTEFTGSSVLYSQGGRGTGNSFPDLGAKTVANDGAGNNGGAVRTGNPGLVSFTVSSRARIIVGAGLTFTRTIVGNDQRFVFTAGTGTIEVF